MPGMVTTSSFAYGRPLPLTRSVKTETKLRRCAETFWWPDNASVLACPLVGFQPAKGGPAVHSHGRRCRRRVLYFVDRECPQVIAAGGCRLGRYREVWVTAVFCRYENHGFGTHL